MSTQQQENRPPNEADASLALASGSAWILASERMPADGQFFLAYGPGLGNYIGGPEIDICRWDGSLWNEGGTEICDARFTYWMPLPPSPNTGSLPPEGRSPAGWQ